MSAQLHDEVRTLVSRIETLERQNRRLKQIAVGGFLFLSVAVLCAVAAGGQQKQENPQARQKGKTPGFVPLPQRWVMPDGRVVEFLASTSNEEIDELTKRIAWDVTDLLPGAKVIGWEARDDMQELLPHYAERVATIPTIKAKLDSLTNAAEVLQAEIYRVQSQKANSDHVNAELREQEKLLNQHADAINLVTALAADNDSRIRAMQFGFGANRELDDFKDAACPTLCAARNRTARLDSVCSCALR